MTDDPMRILRQEDVRASAARKGEEAWTVVYRSWSDPLEEGGEFAAFAPVEYRDAALRRASWDLMIGNGMPGFMQSYDGDETHTTYLRFGNSEGIEPLVLIQSHDTKPRVLPQVSEEFRLYHNLWQAPDGTQLVRVADDGSEEVVGLISHDEVKIRTPLLRQFQAARQRDLLVFIDSVRYVPKVDPDTDFDTLGQEIEGADHRYLFYAGHHDTCKGPFSRFNGKKILFAPPTENAGVWPYEDEDEAYPEFVIGEDEFGVAIMAGANPDEPHYLTPVYFRREVLQRYYEEPEKYSVEDGYLRCAGLWALRMDNNHPDRVMVFLGDLGRDLPESQRDYWRSFNIAPSGSMSETALRRFLLGQFADPSAPDLQFKSLYQRFNDAWEKNKGWRLYLEAHDADAHVFQRLRVPLNESQPEFEDQIAGLAKCLVDFLNEAVIVEKLGESLEGEKGIDKFKRWLAESDYPHTERDIRFLRRLQRIRSRATAHRKGSDYEEFLEKEGVDDDKRAEVVRQLMMAGAEMLTDVARHFDVAL